MVAFEAMRKGKPVFSKDLLKQFDDMRKRAEAGQSPLMAHDINNKLACVWCNCLGTTPKIEVEFLPIQALTELFQLRGFNTTYLDEVRWHNHAGDDAYIPLPMVLRDTSGVKIPPVEVQNHVIDFFSKSLAYAKPLWKASVSARLLEEKFMHVAETSVQIKKIVCFGLGTPESSVHEGRCESHIQHLAIVTIASVLNRVYQASDPSTPPIEIILQDPAYRQMDVTAWKAEYRNLRFVQNPNGFLAIDSNTLAVNAGLPYTVPFLSICTDLLPDGPAGFIHTHLDLNPKKRFWSSDECATPKIVKLLLENYEVSNFDDHPVELEIYKNISNEVAYWLWFMSCFLKLNSKQTSNCER
jgi:hypothetical protein